MAGIDYLEERLVALLGPEHVTRQGQDLLARPASALETAGVINLAREENVGVAPLNYSIGPPAPPVPGGKILLSLDRMNRVRHFDLQGLCLTAEPAAAMAEVIRIASEHGARFPGAGCRHKKDTIGENVASCFHEGEPDFKCQAACLCGLELTLLEGGSVDLGGNCARDSENYSLSYILAGYRDRHAVITGIHLKVLPSRTEEYFLVAAFEQMDDVLAVLVSPAARRGNLKKAVAAGISTACPSAGRLQRLFPVAGRKDVYALFSLSSGFSGLEQAAGEIAAACRAWDTGEVLCAGTAEQKEMVSALFDTLLAELAESEGCRTMSGPHFAPEVRDRDGVCRLRALVWQAGPGIQKAFYA
ncbi:MAG: FAD-binding protein [Peptococcaceae bacterium]|nr:FAD-binding protein [Peptococcaceae bacterium]